MSTESSTCPHASSNHGYLQQGRKASRGVPRSELHTIWLVSAPNSVVVHVAKRQCKAGQVLFVMRGVVQTASVQLRYLGARAAMVLAAVVLTGCLTQSLRHADAHAKGAGRRCVYRTGIMTLAAVALAECNMPWHIGVTVERRGKREAACLRDPARSWPKSIEDIGTVMPLAS